MSSAFQFPAMGTLLGLAWVLLRLGERPAGVAGPAVPTSGRDAPIPGWVKADRARLGSAQGAVVLVTGLLPLLARDALGRRTLGAPWIMTGMTLAMAVFAWGVAVRPSAPGFLPDGTLLIRQPAWVRWLSPLLVGVPGLLLLALDVRDQGRLVLSSPPVVLGVLLVLAGAAGFTSVRRTFALGEEGIRTTSPWTLETRTLAWDEVASVRVRPGIPPTHLGGGIELRGRSGRALRPWPHLPGGDRMAEMVLDRVRPEAIDAPSREGLRALAAWGNRSPLERWTLADRIPAWVLALIAAAGAAMAAGVGAAGSGPGADGGRVDAEVQALGAVALAVAVAAGGELALRRRGPPPRQEILRRRAWGDRGRGAP